MRASSIHNVADTAFMVAAWRAQESERPDALFKDPFAARLAGEHGRQIASELRHRFGPWILSIRTVIIDAFIQTALAQGIDSVLNLGAGLDTRPYRMELPQSLRWVEVDQPQIVELKERELANETPRCSLERLQVDLADTDARRALFAQFASSKTLVITEGVIPYLTTEQVAGLAEDLKSANPALWIVEYLSAESVRYRKRARVAQQMRNAPFQFEPGDWFGFFASHGWRVKEIRYVPEEAERLGRPAPVPGAARILFRLARLFRAGSRIEGFRKSTGYALMERA